MCFCVYFLYFSVIHWVWRIYRCYLVKKFMQPVRIWCFSMGCGLDFNSGSPVFFPGVKMFQNAEGCASLSDPQGNLLFYTDVLPYCSARYFEAEYARPFDICKIYKFYVIYSISVEWIG